MSPLATTIYLIRINHHGICLKTSKLVSGRVVHSLLQLSEGGTCHIWPIGRIKLALLDVNLDGSGPFSLSHSFFTLPLWEESKHD